ncbi:chloride channel protein D [Caerostris extrusa]|uniref:Chloride channel protein D n=1 Tax=Caerostris extrusa TaxID=172846 RepID=A0AAV4SA49_CAEEX|nr:chloride channel protein D [Caerostris extrusa]
MASDLPERVKTDLTQDEISGAERILKFLKNVPGDHGSPLPESDDVTHEFFAKGRDLESAYTMATTTASEIGLGPLGHDGTNRISCWGPDFFLHQFIEIFAELKWTKARKYIEEDNFIYAWLWVIAVSLLFVFISSSSVVILRPSAGGSGLPEIIAFLNGTVVRHIFNVKTLAIKFISCVFAVSSGMPVGPEGPMIHLGSLVGAGCSQLKSSTLKIKLPFFKRFRNSEDREKFYFCWSCSWVASAFGSPVGGLLFSMEEVSSFWNMKLSWQTFFCCMISTFTSDLLNSAFTAFHYEGNFGLFKTEKYILFEVVKRIDLNIIALLPAIIVGMLGGLLGTAFTFLNLKITRGRRKFLSSFKSKAVKQAIQISEPLIIMIIMGTLSVYLPTLLPCSTFTCKGVNEKTDCKLYDKIHIENNVELYNCLATKTNTSGTTVYNISYNEGATLLFLTGDKAIHHLFFP